jgi:hypothetical protein
MPGWDVTVRPAKEEKKKDDNSTTVVIVVVLLALLLLLFYGGGGQQGVGVPDRGTGPGCVQRDASRCDQGPGSGGHRRDGHGSGHRDEDRVPRDHRGP